LYSVVKFQKDKNEPTQFKIMYERDITTMAEKFIV